MNEFVQQFLLESRELVEQATADLLALEKGPQDKDRLDSAFRAFHTLKGGAAIVDFTAMAEAVHAAEDALSAARSGARTVTTQLVADCLACLDQIGRWLSGLEVTGTIPHGVQKEVDAIVGRFAGSARVGADGASPRFTSQLPRWVDDGLSRQPALRESALIGIRYAPDAACFFEGEDPLARIAALPGLLALHMTPASPWESLDTLDPFACNLVFIAFTRSSRADALASLDSALDQCEIVDLVQNKGLGDHESLTAQARAVLEEQIALIDLVTAHGSIGRLASVGVVAANVLRHLGRAADAEHVVNSVQTTFAQNNPRLLRDAITLALSEAMSQTMGASPQMADALSVRTLRITASRIDALANLASELLVVKNAIGHITALAERGDATAALALRQRYVVLDRLVGQLQRSVLSMRVLPLRHAFQRFPRLLREMSVDLGKPLKLVVEGGETEADKAIVEMLFEPLLHVLRNAVDHGVESTTTRVAHGKEPTATIRLCGERLGEHVIIEVSDDGGGIDPARLRQVALEKQFVAAESIDAMSEADIIDLIFEPGFSTAVDVSQVSGRGVGMDAVRTAVAQVGGHVDIESQVGKGTTVRLTLPFSVMMTRVMVVAAGNQAFGIPLDTVVETLRVDASQIAWIGTARVVVLRGRTIPVIGLSEALGLPHAGGIAEDATLVVTKINGEHVALRVDRIGERLDVMLKPFDGLLAGTRGVVGSTLVGDGSVLLILDVAELYQ